jgi:hypothetical protein
MLQFCFIHSVVTDCPCNEKRSDCPYLADYQFDIIRELQFMDKALESPESERMKKGMGMLKALRKYFELGNLYCRIKHHQKYEDKFHIYQTNEHYRSLGEYLLQFEDNERDDNFRTADIKFGTLIECKAKLDEILKAYRENDERQY